MLRRFIPEEALTGVTPINDRIDERASDDPRRGSDAERSGSGEVLQRLFGPVALTACSVSGDTDTGLFSLAERLARGRGSWNQLFGCAGRYGE